MTEKSFSFFNTNSSHCFFSSTILSDRERHPQSPLDDTLFKSYTTTSSSQAGLSLLRCGIIMLANQADNWERRRLPLSLSLSLPLVSPWNSPCLLPLPSYNPAAVASTHPLQHQQSPSLIYSGLKPYSGAGFGSWSPPTLSPRASISSTLSSLKRDPGCPS